MCQRSFDVVNFIVVCEGYKWPQLAVDDTVWLRASVGRDGDDRALNWPDEELVAAVVTDLADTMALRGRPLEARVSRWTASLPQYRPGHLARIDAVEAELAARTPGVVVAGSGMALATTLWATSVWLWCSTSRTSGSARSMIAASRRRPLLTEILDERRELVDRGGEERSD